MHQNAENIYNIDEVGKFHTDQVVINKFLCEILDKHSDRHSNDYYNLIVYGCEPWFDQGHITFTRDRALMEDYYIDSELKARYSLFSPDAISELKTFFCIFAYENQRGRWTAPDQQAAIGRITEIKKRSNGIEIYFSPLFLVNQQRLNDLSF